MEHRDGFKRIGCEILVDETKLAENVIGRCDDVATNLVGLEDIQQLPRRGPDELRLRSFAQDPYGIAHDRNRIDARISDASRKHRDNCRCGGVETLADLANLIEGE